MEENLIKKSVFLKTKKGRSDKFNRCCVDGCNSNRKEINCNLYKFPTEEGMMKKWAENLQLRIEDTKHLKVCCKHFDAKFVGIKKLKKGAIPNLQINMFADQKLHSPIKIKKIIKNVNKCCIESCDGTNINSSLFKFPNNQNKRRIWLQVCGFDDNVQTKILKICARHFEGNFLGKGRLLKGAVPKLKLSQNNIADIYNFDNGTDKQNRHLDENEDSADKLKVLLPNKTYSNLHSNTYKFNLDHLSKIRSPPMKRRRISSEDDNLNESYTCKRCETNVKNITYYRKCNKTLTEKNELLLTENKDLKCKIDVLENQLKNIEQNIDSLEGVNSNSKEFSKMFLVNYKRWDDKPKLLAQNLYYKSSSAYNFLRENLQLNLPSKSSLQRWAPIKKVEPGFNANLIENLKRVITEMSLTEKHAVLIFDEISIRRDLVYDLQSDKIDGFVDLGNEEREPLIGKCICVFMVRGLFHNWKYVLNYFVSDSCIKAEILKELILQNIKLASEIGLHIRAVVCDQGSNNRKSFKLLNLTKESPYIEREGVKIYFFYDVPHLIKSFRNTLMSTDIITTEGIVSWDVIDELYKLDSESKQFRMCPKLTNKHVQPNMFEKMRVCYATQVFSATVAAGIRTCLAAGKFSKNIEQKAVATADFVLKINNIFDCLNSRNLLEKDPYKKPLFVNGIGPNYLRVSIDFLKSLKLSKKNKNYCICGLIQSINATLMLSNELLADPTIQVTFFLTSRLNQDPVENTFAQIRAKRGNMKNPSVYEFKYIIAKLMSMKFVNIVSPNQNCENDDDLMLEWLDNPDLKKCPNSSEAKDSASPDYPCIIADTQNITEDISEENILTEVSLLPSSATEEAFSLETNAKRYYVGYSIFTVIFKRLKCNLCASTMVKTNTDLSLNSEQLILQKDYKKRTDSLVLKCPSDYFFSICEIHFHIYQKIFNNYLHTSDIKKKIIQLCINKTNEVYPEWFSEKCPCLEHKKAILNFLILVLLRKNCTWKIKKEVENKIFHHNRLKNLTQ